MSEKRDNIYIYLWEEFNTVYVGRTVNPKSRHYQHRHIPTEKTYKFSSEHHVEHPKMIIIENNLTVEEGIEREKYWIKEYRENSPFNVLNKLKGGGISNLDKGKWTKETAFEEAKKYNSLSEFNRNASGAYHTSRINDWLKEFKWFKRPIYITKWTKEAVFEESKKYQTRRNFEVGSNSAYNVALKNRWLDEMPWLKIVGHYKKWTKELVFEESKKFSTRNKFHRNSPSAYCVALKNNWLDEMVWLKPDVKWTKEAVFEESKKYSTKVEFKKLSSVAYRVAVKNNWINDMPWIKGKIIRNE